MDAHSLTQPVQGGRGPLTLEGRSAEDGGPIRVVVSDGIVTSIERDGVQPNGTWISAGWSDIQINGYGGHDPNAEGADPARVTAMVRSLWAEGVTGSCVTICTES